MEDPPQPVLVEEEVESPPSQVENVSEHNLESTKEENFKREVKADNIQPDDDDENDTLDEASHTSQASALPDDSMRDESMRTATMDGSKSSRRSSSHRGGSDTDSFVSCSSRRSKKDDLQMITGGGGRSRNNNNDYNYNDSYNEINTSSARSLTLEMATSNRFDDDGGGSSRSGSEYNEYSSRSEYSETMNEYSESINDSRLRAGSRQDRTDGHDVRRKPPRKAAQEGAPFATDETPGPEGHQKWGSATINHRQSRASRAVAGMDGSGASSSREEGGNTVSRSPPRRKSRRVSRRERQINRFTMSAPDLGYGEATPGTRAGEEGGERGGGRRGGGPRRAAGRGGRGGLAATRGKPFSRSSTDEGPRRPMLLRKAATERFVSMQDNGEDGRPTFKRKVRSRSMDMGSSSGGRSSMDDPLRRSSYNNRITVAFGHSREQSHYQPKVIRKCKRMDLRLGGEIRRDVLCQRIIDYPEAMDPKERRRKTVMRTGNEVQACNFSMHGNFHEPQYRIQSRIHAQHRFHKEQMQTQSVQPGPLTTYLIWSLRSPFLIVLLTEACAFWFLICVFSICIYVGALYQPECLRFPGDTNFEENGSYFIDAFALSWTTFSTVGYGVVHPQIRREAYQTSFNCAFMTTLTALEAFVGVLFASFCGAVIVGKMTRAKCTASVRFSERMIVRFGTGVVHTNDDDDRCDDRGEKPVTAYDKRRPHYPCPVLEFRLANTLYADVTGEIMNAKVNVVSSMLAENKPPEPTASVRGSVIGLGGVRPGLDVLKGMSKSGSQFFLRLGEAGSVQASDSTSTNSANNLFLAAKRAQSVYDLEGSGNNNNSFTNSNNNSFSSFRKIWSPAGRANSAPEHKGKEGRKKERHSVLGIVSQVGRDAIESVVIKKRVMRNDPALQPSMQTCDDSEGTHVRRNTTVMEEDPTNGLTPFKLFSSLKLESETHPFFKRVWTIRHVLSADSPLISARAKAIIKASKGRWPAEVCNHDFIRKNVDFQQLIVSLSGTTTGNKVFGLHVYEYRNLHVGYTFSPILQTSPEGRLVVDVDSIDNIQEQRGGGAEAVNYYESSMNSVSAENSEERQEGPLNPLMEGPNSDNLMMTTAHSIDEVDEFQSMPDSDEELLKKKPHSRIRNSVSFDLPKLGSISRRSSD